MTSDLRAGLPVAFLVPRWPPDPGGLGLAAARLARGLAGHVPIVAFVPDERLPAGAVAEAEDGGVRLVRFGARGREATQRGWYELLRRRGPFALVHAVYVSASGFPAVYAARQSNMPCLVAARGNDLDRDPFRADGQAGLLFALAHADAVVGVSRALADQARALGARGEVLAIPNGVAAGRFRPIDAPEGLAAALGVDGPGPLLAFVGEARPKKGLTTMLAALGRVRAVHPDARLWLVGGVRADGRVLVDAAPPGWVVEQLAVDPDDLPALLALASLGWHPSDADGLPNALLESLACGLPTVGARAGGIPDVLDVPALDRLLVPPGDPAALAERTLALLADPADLAALGRERVLTAFTVEAEVRAYLALYLRLMA